MGVPPVFRLNPNQLLLNFGRGIIRDSEWGVWGVACLSLFGNIKPAVGNSGRQILQELGKTIKTRVSLTKAIHLWGARDVQQSLECCHVGAHPA
jgi:hypothetical protein